MSSIVMGKTASDVDIIGLSNNIYLKTTDRKYPSDFLDGSESQRESQRSTPIFQIEKTRKSQAGNPVEPQSN